MSTFDPGLEPPGDWQSPHPHAPAPNQGPNITARWAAVLVWITAGLGLLMSGCCLISALMMGFETQSMLEQMGSQTPPEFQQMDMEQVLKMMALGLGIMTVGLILLPALILAVLGFYVYQGRRGAITGALGLIWLHIIIAGGGLALTLIGAATNGQILSGLLMAFLLGGWLCLCIASVIFLGRARRAATPMYPTGP